MIANRQPSRKELSHQRIVETAALAIRREGFSGVGIADTMKEAGLTHGGFYAHFASRNALLAEAMACAWRGSSVRSEKGKASLPADLASPFRALVEGYLSERHLVATETGCPVAGLAAEMPRQSLEVRAVAAQCVREMFADVQRALRNAPPDRCALIASQMVGPLQVARVLGENAEGKALLTAARRDLLSKHDANWR